jgi:hypothetical protein
LQEERDYAIKGVSKHREGIETMDYAEAMKATVSEAEARYEVETMHCLDFDSFQQDCGYKAEYSGREVLNWLGY